MSAFETGFETVNLYLPAVVGLHVVVPPHARRRTHHDALHPAPVQPEPHATVVQQAGSSADGFGKGATESVSCSP